MSFKRITGVAAMCAALLGAVPAVAQARQPRCGDVITRSVTLRADLQCDTGVGLTVGGDGVTLDLGGHRIVGSLAFPGIVNHGYDRVRIRNGTVTDFGSVVELVGTRSNRLVGLAGDTTGVAVLLEDSSGTTIDTVRMRADGVGLRLIDSTANRIVDSRFSGIDAGVSMGSSDANRFVRTSSGGETGLNIFDSEDNRFADGTVIGSYTGASIVGARNVLVRTTLLGGELGFGVSLTLEGDDNVVRANTVRGGFSPEPAFALEGGHGNVVRDNQLIPPDGFEAEKDGIFVAAPAVDTLLVGNFVTGYPGDGIEVESASTTLRFNVANDNGDFGIEAVPGVRGKGNTASGNGNPLQCLNVACD